MNRIMLSTMDVSYCTTCHGRLWQLVQTIDHNLRYTKVGSVDLCVLSYNDADVAPYLKKHYGQYINDGRLKVFEHNEKKVFADGSTWSCGPVKHIIHTLATGRVLFNLDADNFVDDELNDALLNLGENTILVTKQSEWRNDGRSGRIGVTKSMYGPARYRDVGRRDDGDFITQCLRNGARFEQISCKYPPIDNDRPQSGAVGNRCAKQRL